MLRVSERITRYYHLRREIGHPPDLAILLLAQLLYDPPTRQPATVSRIAGRLNPRNSDLQKHGALEGVAVRRGGDTFHRWLRSYLVINETIRGTSFYPLHPALTLATNGEGLRVEPFIKLLAASFTLGQRDELVKTLWSSDRLPPFEGVIHDLIQRQLPPEPVAPVAPSERFIGGTSDSGLQHFKRFLKQYRAMKAPKQSGKVFKTFYPEYDGTPPVDRDDARFYGYTDDAQLMDEVLFAELKNGFSEYVNPAVAFEKPNVIFTDLDETEWPQKVEDAVGRHWYLSMFPVFAN